MAGNVTRAANEGLAQYIAWSWLGAQAERLYQRSNQCVREYQDIVLSLDMKPQLRAKAQNIFNAGLAVASAVSLRLFLRAQLLMDYWLGIQNWADQLRMTAAIRCRESARSLH
jgi:hypothetical protein